MCLFADVVVVFGNGGCFCFQQGQNIRPRLLSLLLKLLRRGGAHNYVLFRAYKYHLELNSTIIRGKAEDGIETEVGRGGGGGWVCVSRWVYIYMAMPAVGGYIAVPA